MNVKVYFPILFFIISSCRPVLRDRDHLLAGFIFGMAQRKISSADTVRNNDFRMMKLSRRQSVKIAKIGFRSMYGNWVLFKNRPLKSKLYKDFFIVWGVEGSKYAYGNSLGAVVDRRNGRIVYITY